MKVELLYFEGCPGYEELRPRVQRLLAERGLEGRLDLASVESAEKAAARRFLGSPSLRVGGHDVEPGADERSDFGMTCRIYSTAEGPRHAPFEELIRSALDRAG